MAKLTKAQTKLHDEACALLRKDRLSIPEREFVIENWHPGANHNTGRAGVFFTPMDLAGDVAMYRLDRGRIVDIGAGIGNLSRALLDMGALDGSYEVTCVEANPEYAAVGRKVVPEARWVVGDIFDQATWEGLGQFDQAISNPPFGRIAGRPPEVDGWIGYGGPADLMAVGVALKVTGGEGGVFILPQGSVPFTYSGKPCHSEVKPSDPLKAFMEKFPKAVFECSSIDTEVYRDLWRDAKPKVEICSVHEA